MSKDYKDEIQEVIMKTVDGAVSIQLQEFFVRNGEPFFNKINEKTTEIPRVYLNFAPNYVYFNVEYQYENDIELKSVLYMWEQFLQKNTNAVEKGEQKAYSLLVNLFRIEDGICYSIEGKNPVLTIKEGSKAIFIFDTDEVNVSKFNVNEEMIDKEVEHEMKIREEQMEKDNEYLNADSDIY